MAKIGEHKVALFVLFCLVLVPVFAFLLWREMTNDNGENSLERLAINQNNTSSSTSSSVPQTQAQSQAVAQPPAAVPQNNVEPPANFPEEANSGQEEVPQENKINESEEEKPGENTEVDQVIYEEKNFEFKHPKEAKISQSGSYVLVKDSEQSFRLRVYENKNKQDLETWYKENFSEKERKNCAFESANAKIGTYETKITKSGSEEAVCEEVGYWAVSEEKDLIVRIKIDAEPEPEIKKILETFKFKE